MTWAIVTKFKYKFWIFPYHLYQQIQYVLPPTTGDQLDIPFDFP